MEGEYKEEKKGYLHMDKQEHQLEVGKKKNMICHTALDVRFCFGDFFGDIQLVPFASLSGLILGYVHILPHPICPGK